MVSIHRRIRRATLPKPFWMTTREFRRFERYRSAAMGRPKGELTPNEEGARALLKWVQRTHSDFNPRRPEFPPARPKFPATPAKRLRLPEFRGVEILVKDESLNPTGTHKDRMAWEIARMYGRMLEAKAEGKINGRLPAVSLVSSGNAAIALGEMMHAFGLPKPHILVSTRTPEEIIVELRKHHVDVYETDLAKRALTSDEILERTRNPNGIDLTRGRMANELGRTFYDWMTFEVLNTKPDYIIVPYGSGQLFNNLFEHYYDQLQRVRQLDPRLRNPRTLQSGVNLIGVTSPIGSIASMLSAPHLPESVKEETQTQKSHVISQMRRAGVLGEKSGIHEIHDEWILRAANIALNQRMRFEPSALAGLAWLLQHKKDIPKGKRVLIVSTGKGKLI